MSLARTHAITLVGVQGHPVEIEADIENGLVALLLVGLPDTALREARDRIRSAIVNSGESWPQRRITVGLSPASLPKRGSGFDLGIAAAILAAAGAVPAARLSGAVLLGELGLDGKVRPVTGVLPAAAAAAAAGFGMAVVPAENAPEACLVPQLRVAAVPNLEALVDWLRGEPARAGAGVQVFEPGQGPPPAGTGGPGGAATDLADVVGQPTARRAAEICAAGGHHLLLLGPPGVGKTMLAERLPTVLPRLEPAAALEVSAIHSIAGQLPAGRPLISEPPFCAPHHTATKAAIVGGGSAVIRPGAASLAHHGCLFLDEAPEFCRDVLDALRQPLESGEVVIARSGLTARFPARFTLVLAANPCPCARASAARLACSCSPAVRRRYLGRLSGPLLDRVDVKVEFLPVGRAELLSDRRLTEPSAVVAERVRRARGRAAARLRGTPWRLNAEIPGSELRRRYVPAAGALAPLERAMDLGTVSARGADRIIRLSWTLADLADVPRPGAGEISYALALWLGAGI
ncbi:MAG: YifB family Mg chelatase-like AAA ATPase [Streptosporangiaceae bacterium]|jgi:magnesium chelatase family protein